MDSSTVAPRGMYGQRPSKPSLEPGRVYGTKDLERWDENVPRLAKRLVEEGTLVPLAYGLYSCPKRGRFGVVPPTDEQLMKAFLENSPFVFTGPDRWNALGLGSTAVFAATLVYNKMHSGSFEFGSRTFELQRVAFPQNPTPEWFVVDLFENAHRAGASRAQLMDGLVRALGRGVFDHARLSAMAQQYGTKATQALVNSALRATSA